MSWTSITSRRKTRAIRGSVLYLLVFDVTFSSFNSLHRAQTAAEKIIDSASEADMFGVAAMTGERFESSSFSRDRIALVHAIELAAVENARSLRLAPRRRSVRASRTGR
jgi:hypothetical protein